MDHLIERVGARSLMASPVRAGFQFPPQGNAFQQGAAFIEPGQSQGQGGIHVKVRVDETVVTADCLRASMSVCGLPPRWPFADVDDPPVLDGHINGGATVGQGGVFD